MLRPDEREFPSVHPALRGSTGRYPYAPHTTPEPTPEQVERELLRADLCAVATKRCYKHGALVVDDILADFTVTRKPLKEKKK